MRTSVKRPGQHSRMMSESSGMAMLSQSGKPSSSYGAGEFEFDVMLEARDAAWLPHTIKQKCLRGPSFGELPAGLLAAQHHELYLLCEIVGGRKVAVALDKHAADHEHRLFGEDICFIPCGTAPSILAR